MQLRRPDTFLSRFWSRLTLLVALLNAIAGGQASHLNGDVVRVFLINLDVICMSNQLKLSRYVAGLAWEIWIDQLAHLIVYLKLHLYVCSRVVLRNSGPHIFKIVPV